MKKGFVCLLVALMLLTMAACDGGEDVRGTVSGGESVLDGEVTTTSTTETTATSTVGTTIASTMTSTGATTTTATSVATTTGSKTTTTTSGSHNEGFRFGSTAGGTYTNDYIGIGCKLDSSWTFKSDEEILKLNNLTKDLLDEDIAELLESAQVIYDMMAVHSNGMDNVLINLEKTSVLQAALTDLKAMLEQTVPTVESALTGMGYTNFAWEVGEATIDGKRFAALKNSSEINGVTMYQLTLVFRCNQHLASLCISTYGEDKTNQILNTFYLLD